MIQFDQVGITYDGASGPVLQGVNLRIDEGELCLVIGQTGSGKSTLLAAINGLVPYFTGGTLTGRVVVGGRDTAHFRPRELADVVGFVGQDPVAGFVTDTVEEELAYTMEQLAIDPAGCAPGRRRPWTCWASPTCGTGRCAHCLAASSSALRSVPH